MRPKYDVCRRCKWFKSMNWDNPISIWYGCENFETSGRHKIIGHYEYRFKKSGGTEITKPMTFNRKFRIPDECPYLLEHIV